MSKNRSDLINRCLSNLGILVTGQSVDPEMVAKMDALIDPAISTLSGLDIYSVPDAGTPAPPVGGDIDDAVFLPLADWIANRAAVDFNLAADTKMQALAQLAEGNMITLGAPPRTKRVLDVDPATRVPRVGYYRGGF